MYKYNQKRFRQVINNNEWMDRWMEAKAGLRIAY